MNGMHVVWFAVCVLTAFSAQALEGTVVRASPELARVAAAAEADTLFIWRDGTTGGSAIRIRNDANDKPGCGTIISLGVRDDDLRVQAEAHEYCGSNGRWEARQPLVAGLNLFVRLPEVVARGMILALPAAEVLAGSRVNINFKAPLPDQLSAMLLALVEPGKSVAWNDGNMSGAVQIVGPAVFSAASSCAPLLDYKKQPGDHFTAIRACQDNSTGIISFVPGDYSAAQGYPSKTQIDLVVAALAKRGGDYSQSVVPEPPMVVLEKPTAPTPRVTQTLAKTATASGAPLAAPVTTSPKPGSGTPPMRGFALDQLSEQAKLRDSRFPWGERRTEGSGPIDPAQLTEHNATVSQAMARMQTLHGKWTPQQEKDFSAIWAPFFDFPTAGSQEYFKQLNPALDDYLVAATAVEELAPAYRDSLVNLATAAATGDDQGTAAALQATNAQARALEEARQKLNASAARIKRLGNPPNPLAARNAAREMHRRAVGGDDSIWQLLRRTSFVVAVDDDDGIGDFVLMQDDFKPKAELRWNGRRFQYRSIDPFFDTPCREFRKGELYSQDKTELTGNLSVDGRSLLDVSGTRVKRMCTDATNGVFEEEKKTINQVQLQAKLYQNKPIEGGTARIWLAYTNHVGAPNMEDPALGSDELLVSFRNYLDVRPIDISKAMKGLGGIVGEIGGVGCSSAKDPWGNCTQSGDLDKHKADDQRDDRIVFGEGASSQRGEAAGADAAASLAAAKEAIAQHLVLAKQREESGARWAAEAMREKDAKRKAELENRAAWEKDMAQAERDIASSLETGVIVRTRTAWDDKQQQKLIANIKTELAEFDKDKQRLDLIPKLAGLVSGADGVRIREDVQKRIQEAIKAPDRGAQLDKLQQQLRKVVVSQREIQLAKETEKVAEWDARIRTAEGIKQGADAALWAASLLVPGSSAVSMAYGIGTGYAEGGVTQAVENSARAYSDKIDIAVAVVRGGLERDADTNERGGVSGAAWAGLSTYVSNKLTGAIASKTTGVIQGGINKARAGSAAAPAAPVVQPEAFRDNHERYQEALQAAKTPQQQQAVQQRYRVIAARESLRGEMRAVTERHEKLIPAAARNSDGSVNTQHPGYQQARAAWEADMAKVRQSYAGEENRMTLHRDALAEAFLHSNDIPLSGGQPKTIMSDMDVSPRDYAAGKKYVQALQKGGLDVLDYSDRWVVPGADITVWKPGHGVDKPGSSSFELATIYDSLPGSDKFSTRGGVEYTTQGGKTGDPRGAVTANLKKAVEAGVGGNRATADLHVVGKSLDKAIEIAGIQVDAATMSKARLVRGHATREEAGIATFGASADFKAREQARFLSQSQKALADAYQAASQKSDQAAAALKTELAAAEARGDTASAHQIRESLLGYKISNDMALQTIARSDPATVGLVLSQQTLPPPGQGNTEKLLSQLTQERSTPPAPPSSPAPAMPDVAERCKVAATAVAEKLKVAKAGSPEAAYLSGLRKALEQGSRNPAQAVTEVRLLSGMELSQVLQQLAPAKEEGQRR